MEAMTLIDLIPTLGFPIICVIALGWFVWYMFKEIQSSSQENLEKLQKRCQEREDKLYKELNECHKINADAMKVIAGYAERLDSIQTDVGTIKTDITIIKAKVE